MDKKTLNILGCVPKLLNVLLELAQESNSFNSFNILRNIELTTSITDDFTVLDGWSVNTFDCFKGEFPPRIDGPCALSVVGSDSKPFVHNYYKTMMNIEEKQFIRLIHPSSVVSPSAVLGYGAQVEPLSVIASCTELGFGVNIKRNCSIGHHCILNDYVTINPGATLSSGVTIGSSTLIGSGVTIKDSIHIGENTIIGVGSVVTKDIPSNCVAYGNPCKVVKSRKEYLQKK